MNSQSLARGLAFFSVGLGLAELLAPRRLARAIGVDEDHETLLRLLGLRELGAGVGIMQGSSAGFVWSRVGGDLIDLGLLATALRSRRSKRNRVLGAMGAVAAVTALDIAAGILLSRNPAEPDWRVRREDLGGFERDDPAVMRRRADETMTAHQSGHLRGADEAVQRQTHDGNGHYEMKAREDDATQEFEPGD